MRLIFAPFTPGAGFVQPSSRSPRSPESEITLSAAETYSTLGYKMALRSHCVQEKRETTQLLPPVYRHSRPPSFEPGTIVRANTPLLWLSLGAGSKLQKSVLESRL